MPKNKGQGGKNRKKGKTVHEFLKRELVLKEENQEYAQVIKILGNCYIEAMCFDNKKRHCHIRGKLRKKVWINLTDIILISLRDFQEDKADVILKYTPDEAKQLKSKGEIPDSVNITETEAGSDIIFFDEEPSDGDLEDNVSKNYFEDITDSDDEATIEGVDDC